MHLLLEIWFLASLDRRFKEACFTKLYFGRLSAAAKTNQDSQAWALYGFRKTAPPRLTMLMKNERRWWRMKSLPSRFFGVSLFKQRKIYWKSCCRTDFSLFTGVFVVVMFLDTTRNARLFCFFIKKKRQKLFFEARKAKLAAFIWRFSRSLVQLILSSSL